MSLFYYQKFIPSLHFLNPNAYFVYVEAATESGGDAATIQMRNSSKGLPLTLVEQFLPEELTAPLSQETSERDVTACEKQFQVINYVLNNGGVVCLPSQAIQEQITILEKCSPKMAGYVLKRFDHLTSNHSPPPVELPS